MDSNRPLQYRPMANRPMDTNRPLQYRPTANRPPSISNRAYCAVAAVAIFTIDPIHQYPSHESMAASGSSASTKIANYEWAWPRVSAYVAYANVSSPSIVRIARWRRWRSLRLIQTVLSSTVLWQTALSIPPYGYKPSSRVSPYDSKPYSLLKAPSLRPLCNPKGRLPLSALFGTNYAP